MKIWALLIAVAMCLAACGQGDGGNGRDGRDGSDGKPGENGGNGSGGENGSDGIDALKSAVACVLKWEHETPGRGYDLSYNVIEYSNGLKSAMFNYNFYNEQSEYFYNEISATFNEQSQAYSSAKLENDLWEVSLVSENQAKILYKPLNKVREVACKFQQN